jgi:1D-myo-inositol-tetrakisphosphate 5-kinase/inositol-polyphosphate multikinase
MLVPAQHQAAGHDGTMTDADGSLFIKKSAVQEIEFYNLVAAHDAENDLDMKLSYWIPVCLGNLQAGVNRENLDKLDLSEINHQIPLTATDGSDSYVVLENLYHNYNFPSILDVKLGSKLTDDESTHPSKIERLNTVSRQTTSGTHNFRVCGMKTFNGSSSTLPASLYDGMVSSIEVVSDNSSKYLQFNKMFGRLLTSSTVVSGIELFFSPFLTLCDHSIANTIIYRLSTQFLKRLQLLYNCLLDYELRMFSASLLFMYETDLSKWDIPENGVLHQDHFLLDDEKYDMQDPLIKEFAINEDDESDDDNDDITSFSLSQLKLIDFAHSKLTPGMGHDENVIQGIENLIEVFQTLSDKYKT